METQPRSAEGREERGGPEAGRPSVARGAGELPGFRPAGPPPGGPAPGESPDVLGLLRHIDGLLEELRGRVEAVTRTQRHREFSFARLAGGVLQVLVAGLVIAALADWLFNAREIAAPLIKLMFAGVLQLGALTAFLLGRDGGP